ncbi:MAG: NADH-quinone oxidoreductase subunit C [Candidatus Omnitrophota bacterium]
MTREEVLKDLKEKFQGDILDIFEKSPKRVYIGIQPAALVKITTHIFKGLKARFNIATGTDMRHSMEILYHFTLEDINLVVSLRATLTKPHLEIDSLTSVFKGADWIEREIHELLGIRFKGHPNLKRLLLPDEWPEGVYPLRQDYEEWDKKAIRDRGV